MPPRWGNRGSRSSGSSSRRSSGTGRQQRQRAQRTRSRGAQRGLTSRKKEVQKKVKAQQQKTKIRDVKAEQEANEASYLNKVVPGISGPAGRGVTYQQLMDDRKRAAYNVSKTRQAEMKKAIDMVYSTQQMGGGSTDPNDPDYNPDATTKEVSQFHNLTDAQKQFLIDSGFAAAESEGILGGTFGAELVSNRLKKDLADATTTEEYNKALAALDRLHGGKDITKGQGITDQMAKMGLLQHDPSAVYSWGDVESDPYLYKAHQELGSKDLTPGQYTDYMDKIKAFGHMGTPPVGGGSGGGGWGGDYGGGYGGGGGGGGYAGLRPHPQQGIAQPPGVGPGTLQEQVNQGFLSGMGTRFSRGGIVSLLRLRR